MTSDYEPIPLTGFRRLPIYEMRAGARAFHEAMCRRRTIRDFPAARVAYRGLWLSERAAREHQPSSMARTVWASSSIGPQHPPIPQRKRPPIPAAFPFSNLEVQVLSAAKTSPNSSQVSPLKR